MLNDLKDNLRIYAKKFVTIAVIITAVSLSFKWMLSPHLQSLKAASRYNQIVSMKESRIDLLQKEIENNQQKLTKLKHQYKQLQKKFFYPGDTVQFFTSLPKIAEKNNCTLLSQVALENSPKTINSKLIKPRKTALVIQAAYDDFINFLTQLGSMSHKVTIGEIEVAAQSDSDQQLVYGLTIVIYVLQDKGY